MNSLTFLFIAFMGCFLMLASSSYQVSAPVPTALDDAVADSHEAQEVTPKEFRAKREALRENVLHLSRLSFDELKDAISNATGLTSTQIDQLADDFYKGFRELSNVRGL